MSSEPSTVPDAARTDAAPRPRRPFLVILPGLIFLALAGLFLVRLFSGDPSKLPSTLIGRPAPVTELPPLAGLVDNGKPMPGLADASLRDGRTVTLVNVFASWCVPCRDEHPFLLELAKDPSIRLVGINYKDQQENARRFLGALGNPYAAVGVDAAGRTGIEWGVYGVPETFVLAPDGRVVFKQVGPIGPQALAGAIRDAIAKARQPR